MEVYCNLIKYYFLPYLLADSSNVDYCYVFERSDYCYVIQTLIQTLMFYFSDSGLQDKVTAGGFLKKTLFNVAYK